MRNREDLKQSIESTNYNEEQVGLPTDEVTMDPETKYGRVKKSRLVKLRKDQGEARGVFLRCGEIVKIVSKKGSHFKIRVRGMEGTILSNCIEEG